MPEEQGRPQETDGGTGAGERPEPVRMASALPKVAMLFSADSWTFNVRLGRSGREESEGIIIMGEVSYRGAEGERLRHPARAMIVKADQQKRLDMVLSPNETVLTIPLEAFSMQRMQDRLKDLVGQYGMRLRISFQAAETENRQLLDAVDFAFFGEPRDPDFPGRG